MPIKFDTTNRTPLTEGGEGYIYEYNGKIVKTFKPHIDLSAKQRKVNRLMKETLPNAVIKPIDSVLDMQGRFIGYCMEKANGEEFKRLSNRKFCTANNADTKFVLGILVNAKSVLQEIHKRNIYVGDLNDQNILFDSAGNVFFIDCDSWSVGNDKCAVAMDLFKDPKLKADEFNADTDNYAFAVLAWKSLTRIHPFGGTMTSDMPITDRIVKGISVIGRTDVKIPRTAKAWNGFSPDLVSDFKKVFESGLRTLSDSLEDMQKNLSYCQKDKEYYYSKFSSCPYCDSNAQVNKKPVSQGIVGGMKLIALYDSSRIKAVFGRYAYLDNEGYVICGNNKKKYSKGNRYYFASCGAAVFEDEGSFNIEHEHIGHHELKKYKSMVEVVGNKIYFISRQNTFRELTIVNEKNNAIKNICKVSNTSYFSVSDGNYCIVNYYSGKLIVNINGTNTVIDYDSDIQNYGIHRDEISGKWLLIFEDSKGKFNTYVLDGKSVEYHTESIKYACQLNFPCIYNSNIFIPIDGKIRGFNYQKSAFKDFECSVVSDESKLIKEKKRFVIVNFENVYYLEN